MFTPFTEMAYHSTKSTDFKEKKVFDLNLGFTTYYLGILFYLSLKIEMIIWNSLAY